MSSVLLSLVLLLARYVHVVSTTLLVGGTLFYEMVVPIAIDELRDEQKLFIIARARWVFKWIVWVAAGMIVISGAISTWDHWDQYTGQSYVQPVRMSQMMIRVPPSHLPAVGRPGWWWAAHTTAGVIAVMIALALTIGPVPPSRPVRWMRFNLVILLLVMFLATATRYARMLSDMGRPQPEMIEHIGS